MINSQSVCLVTQSCPTLCDSMDCSPPGSSIHGIFQARILERVAVSFSRASSRPRTETSSTALQADSLPLSHQGSAFLTFIYVRIYALRCVYFSLDCQLYTNKAFISPLVQCFVYTIRNTIIEL